LAIAAGEPYFYGGDRKSDYSAGRISDFYPWLEAMSHRRARNKQLLDLLLYKSYADLKSECVGTRGGFLWWFLEPALHMAIYYALFGVLLQLRTEDFTVFLLVGLVVWRWFNGSVSQGSASIISGRRLIQKIYTPRSFFPSVTLLTNTVKFMATLLVLMVFLWVYGLPVYESYLALPVLLALQFLFIAGVVYICAALIPFFPDLRILLSNFLRAMMFFSGIFFDAARIPEHLQFWFYLNPMAGLIKAYREVLIEGVWPNWDYLLIIGAISVALLIAGKKLLAKLDPLYPRVLQA
jgi:lipopolysaccharide transport system permease protein